MKEWTFLLATLAWTFLTIHAMAASVPTAVTDSGTRLEFRGYSVLPPPGNDWFVFEQDRGHILFFKKLESEFVTHTFGALVATSPVSVRFKNPDEFLAYAKKEDERDSSSKRHRVLLSEATSDDGIGSRYCVRYFKKAEDHGVSIPGVPYLMMEIYGYVCLHPELPGLLININYSERYKPDEGSPALRAEGEKFIKSFKFTSLDDKDSKEIEHEAYLEEVKTSLRNSYCGDPVNLSCIGESESTCQAQLETVVIPACSKKFLEPMAKTANDADRKRILQAFFNCVVVTHLQVKYRDLDILAQKAIEMVQCRERREKK